MLSQGFVRELVVSQDPTVPADVGSFFFLASRVATSREPKQVCLSCVLLDGTRRFQVIILEPVTVIDRRCYHHHGFMVKVEVEVVGIVI